MGFGLSSGLGLGGRSPKAPAAATATELLRLKYIDETNADPLVSISDWTIDRHFGATTSLTDNGWEAKSTNGQGSMHADIGILNLSSQSVFVGLEGVAVPNGSVTIAFLVTKGHAPGVFWTATDGYQTDGYHCQIKESTVIVKGYDGSGSSHATSPNFGDAIVEGVLGKIEMRVVIGGASNVIQMFLDDVQLGSDWADSHANRIQGAEVFGTIGCAVSFAGGGAGIIEQVYSGTL